MPEDYFLAFSLSAVDVDVDSLFLCLDVSLTGMIDPVPLLLLPPFRWFVIGCEAATFLVSPLLCFEILTRDAF